jgi:hypothetical protein
VRNLGSIPARAASPAPGFRAGSWMRRADDRG